MELWKPIPDYQGYYEASSMGRIRSVTRYIPHPRNTTYRLIKTGKILKSELDKSGYPVVTLSKDRKTRTYKVHRLVAKAFIPNPDNLPQIDHINCIRYDNRPENLRWCTQQQNTDWREDHHTEGDRCRYKILCKETGKVFESSYNVASWVIEKRLTKKTTNYRTVSKGIRQSCYKGCRAYGYHWTYVEGSTTTSEKVGLK
jgi:hypothetical protein